MILVLLLLNATVGFVQEFQAGSIVDELKKTLALKAEVLRGANLGEIPAPMIVPGDILHIEEVSPPFLLWDVFVKLTDMTKGCYHPG